MHFATAVKLVLGLRVAFATNGAIVASNAATLATTATVNIPYVLGFALGSLVSSIGFTVVLFFVGLVAVSSGGNSTECENYCDAIEQYQQDYAIYQEQQSILDEEYDTSYQDWLEERDEWKRDYYQPYQSCWSQNYQPVYDQCIIERDGLGVFLPDGEYLNPHQVCSNRALKESSQVCSDLDPPPEPIQPNYYDCCYLEPPELSIHEPDNSCNCEGFKKVWLQVVYGSLDDGNLNNNLTFPKGCWIVAYEYDEDNNLSITYNPGLNEVWLKSLALLPDQVQLNSNIEVQNDIETAKGWDRAYWNAIQVDVECRGWQPGDLIPTR